MFSSTYLNKGIHPFILELVAEISSDLSSSFRGQPDIFKFDFYLKETSRLYHQNFSNLIRNYRKLNTCLF